MAFYEPMMLEFHVLLVDHDMNSLLETCRLLQFNLYKVELIQKVVGTVTPIQDATVASLMLSEGNSKFDLVMVDVYSSNTHGFKLVHEAAKLGLEVIVMSSNANANATQAMCAIEDGVFLFMEKPIIVEDLKYLWQHAFREKVRKSKENWRRGETSIDNINYYQFGNSIDSNTTTDIIHINIGGSKNNKGENGIFENIIDVDSGSTTNGRWMKPKMCTEWTPELHEKFMAAVEQLGDGKCFPKEILEIMKVPGLTRMQVASHLQKCRYYGWQHPHKRQTRGTKASKSSNSTNWKRSNSRRYGSFPRLIKDSQPHCTIPGNQNDDELHNMEHGTPSHNTGQVGTFDNVSNNNVVIDMSNENAHGNVAGALDQGLQSDGSYGFASVDNDGLIRNNFNFQESACDQVVTSQTSQTANEDEPSFWKLWLENFASDDLEKRNA